MLDPNIILAAKPMELDNPLDVAQKAQSIKEMMNQNELGNLQVVGAQRNEADEQQLRQAFQNNVTRDENGNSTINRKGVLNELYQGPAERAMTVQQQWINNDVAVNKQMRENAKVDAEIQGMKIKNAKDRLDIHNNQVDRARTLYGTSVDQASYTANRQQAINEGLPDAEKTPEVYDPAYVKTQLNAAAGAKTSLENATKQAELQLQTHNAQLKALEFQNKIRHEGVTENLEAVNAGRQQFNANRDATHRIVDEYLHLPIVEKTFPVIKENYDKMQALAKSGEGFSDYGLMEGILRMYNPGVTVRQGQLASAAQELGIPSRLKAIAEKVDQGGLIAPEARQSIMQEAQRIYNTQAGAVGDAAKEYRARMQSEGLNPGLIPDVTQTGGVKGPGSGEQIPGKKTLSSAEVIAMANKNGRPVSEIVSGLRAAGYVVQ